MFITRRNKWESNNLSILVSHLSKLVELALKTVESIGVHADLAELVPDVQNSPDDNDSNENGKNNDQSVHVEETLVVEGFAVRSRVVASAVAASNHLLLVESADSVTSADVVVDARALSGASVDSTEEHHRVTAVVGRTNRGEGGNSGDSIGAAQGDRDGLLSVLAITAAATVGTAEISILVLDDHSHGGIGHIIETHLGVLFLGVIQGQSGASGVLLAILGKQEDGRRLLGGFDLSALDTVLSLLALAASLHIARNGNSISAEVEHKATMSTKTIKTYVLLKLSSGE